MVRPDLNKFVGLVNKRPNAQFHLRINDFMMFQCEISYYLTKPKRERCSQGTRLFASLAFGR